MMLLRSWHGLAVLLALLLAAVGADAKRGPALYLGDPLNGRKETVNKVNWDNAIPAEKTAYAFVLHDDGGSASEAIFLALQVAIGSLQKTGTRRDIVVLISETALVEHKTTLQDMGCKLKVVPDVAAAAYPNDPLMAVPMSIDADVLVMLNIDELFLCGHFCLFFHNWLFYTAGVAVLKPDIATKDKLIEQYKYLELPKRESVKHCTEATDKLIFAEHQDLEAAPFFYPENGQSNVPTSRLQLSYSMNSIYYYEHFSWHLITLPEFKDMQLPAPAFTMNFPQARPWFFWNHYFFDCMDIWEHWRAELLQEDWTLYLASRLVLLGALAWGATVGVERVFRSAQVKLRCLPIRAFTLRVLKALPKGWGAEIVGLVIGILSTILMGVYLTPLCIGYTTVASLAWPLFPFFHTIWVYAVLHGISLSHLPNSSATAKTPSRLLRRKTKGALMYQPHKMLYSFLFQLVAIFSCYYWRTIHIQFAIKTAIMFFELGLGGMLHAALFVDLYRQILAMSHHTYY